MEWNRQSIKGLLIVVCGGAAFYCLLQHLDAVWGAARWLMGILAPFLIGGALAFVLNVPMRAIERHMGTAGGRAAGLRRPAALVLTLLAVIAVLALAGQVIGPGVGEAAMSVVSQIPAAFLRLQDQLNDLSDVLPAIQEWMTEQQIDWDGLTRKALECAETVGGSIVTSGGGLIGGVVSGVSTFVIGLIFSFYILLQKEKLSRQGRQVLYGLLPQRRADRTLEILRLANRTFSSFLSGQCLEACILGTLFVVAMTIFRMPYALLVGVLIALTALIPIVGPSSAAAWGRC